MGRSWNDTLFRCTFLGVSMFFISAVVSNVVFTARAHRDRAMTFWNYKLLTPQAHPGQIVRIAYDYDKRADCTPPEGYGDFYYRLFVRDVDGQYSKFYKIDAGNASLEAAGKNRHAELDVLLPANLPEGVYGLTFRGIFQCKGEADPQFVEPDHKEELIID